MTKTHKKILAGLVGLGLLGGALVYSQLAPAVNIEGEWECKTSWSWDNDGKSVPCTLTSALSCVDGTMSSTGVLSIGSAQWSEAIAGTYRCTSEAICGTRARVTVTPQNAAARAFERDQREGKPLGSDVRLHEEACMQVTSWTETQFTTVNHEGRVTTCTRR
jgi:hypothetical protein